MTDDELEEVQKRHETFLTRCDKPQVSSLTGMAGNCGLSQRAQPSPLPLDHLFPPTETNKHEIALLQNSVFVVYIVSQSTETTPQPT